MSGHFKVRTDLQSFVENALGPAYVVERELSTGGANGVFVAEEKALGRRVVIKVLTPEMAGGAKVQRFLREIHLAARLQPHERARGFQRGHFQQTLAWRLGLRK